MQQEVSRISVNKLPILMPTLTRVSRWKPSATVNNILLAGEEDDEAEADEKKRNLFYGKEEKGNNATKITLNLTSTFIIR